MRAGGGANHRVGLYDMVLVKDNHADARGGVAAAARAAMEQNTRGLAVEVEVRTLEELDDVLPLGVDRVLLDNMTPEMLREAVRRAHALGDGRPELEASGNVTLQTVRAVAETGVDFISVGALTHSAPTRRRVAPDGGWGRGAWRSSPTGTASPSRSGRGSGARRCWRPTTCSRPPTTGPGSWPTRAPAPFSVVLAEEQTAGRGRSGHRGTRRRARGSCSPPCCPGDGAPPPHLPLLVGLAAARAVEAAVPGWASASSGPTTCSSRAGRWAASCASGTTVPSSPGRAQRAPPRRRLSSRARGVGDVAGGGRGGAGLARVAR